MKYVKRLIEVDLPIKRISAHARREKSIRHGHISTLHIWWARRPLAACRAVLCASLWPDPADDLCPDSFRKKARELMQQWVNQNLKLLSAESLTRFITYQKDPTKLNDNEELRKALLDFIADFADWTNFTLKEYLETSRKLTQIAHETLGSHPGTRPVVFDPFAGGGSIPLEALRIGADAFACDLNPIPVLINRVLLEYIPRYGEELIKEFERFGRNVKTIASKKLGDFYPMDSDGSVPTAYLWARTINCEGPKCGYRIPLIRTMKLDKHYFLQVSPKKNMPEFSIAVRNDCHNMANGTIKGGSVTCPHCNYTTSALSTRKQLERRAGGASDAQLLAVQVESEGRRLFRSANSSDLIPVKKAMEWLKCYNNEIPSGKINPIRPYKNTRGLSAVTRIGIFDFRDLYTQRQMVSLLQFIGFIQDVIGNEAVKPELELPVRTLLAFAFSRMVHQNSSLSRWQNNRSTIAGAFGKQALQITWDFAETNPIGSGSGTWENAMGWIRAVIDSNLDLCGIGNTSCSSAKNSPLPDDSVDFFFTDPPYFAAIPYGDLSGFFYIWHKKILAEIYPELFSLPMVNQNEEAIVTNANFAKGDKRKDETYYTNEMTLSFEKARLILRPNGISTIVFADSSTGAWEAILSSVINSGWIITASWPIDTELQSRTQARNAASLQSSIHLVCRPRENPDGSLREEVGDWRDVLQELPKRIHEWMPRLAKEGVVGADAIFACLGPALEIFSRYSKVEKASGAEVNLQEYLLHVWAAVEKEALNMIFEGADAAGFEEDSRLTAMWLWTLSTGANGNGGKESTDEKTTKSAGYTLEFDAARKIAQGLGAHLEKLGRMVEIKGDKARLLSVAERTKYLFGKDESQAPVGRRKTAKCSLILWRRCKKLSGRKAAGVKKMLQEQERLCWIN